MKPAIFLFFLFLIHAVITKKIQQSDYCFDSIACSKEFNYQCMGNLCSKSKLTCKSFESWYFIKRHINILKIDKSFKKFSKSIKNCPKWNPNDVCINSGICYKNTLLPHRQWLIGKVSIRKEIKCKCIGKYSYSCGKDQKYCSADKGACQRMNSTEIITKNCKI